MTIILIKDLAASIELDQEAMSVIYGGARSSQSSAQQQLKQALRPKRKISLLDQAREKQLRLRF